MAEVQDWKVEIETVHTKVEHVTNIDENRNQSNAVDTRKTQQYHLDTLFEKVKIISDEENDTIKKEILHEKVEAVDKKLSETHALENTETDNNENGNIIETKGLSVSPIYLETKDNDTEIGKLPRSSPVLTRKRNKAINKGSPESNRNSFISISSESSSDSPNINTDNRKSISSDNDNSANKVFNFDSVNDQYSRKMKQIRKEKAKSLDFGPKNPIINSDKREKSQSFDIGSPKAPRSNSEGSPRISKDKRLFGGINSPKLFRKLRGSGDQSPKTSRSPKIPKSPKIKKDNKNKGDNSPKNKKAIGDRSSSNDSDDFNNEKDDIVGDLRTSKQFDRQINTHQRLSRKTSYVVEEIVNYCVPLVKVEFVGQSSTVKTDKVDNSENVLNLGVYLSLLDRVIRKYKDPLQFTIKDEEYCSVLRLVATKRCLKKETTEECYERLMKDSEEFEKIYHERNVLSDVLTHKYFWGTRQQLLCGKVIADWIDTDRNTAIDPIFGALLCPCGGRVGPGDAGWMHSVFFDDRGFMAYHSAVHDAFGYLITYHGKGPGYDYMKKSKLGRFNPLSGQYDGISFWRNYLKMKVMPDDLVRSTFVMIFGGINSDGIMLL